MVTVPALLAGEAGAIATRLRFTQVDRLGNVLVDLTPAAVDGGQVDLDNTRAVGRTLTLTMDITNLPASFLTAPPALFNVQVLFEVLQGGVWQTFPLGLFWIDSPLETATPGTRLWAIKGSDLTALLNVARTATTYVVPAGSDYLGQVSAIAAMLGLQTGFSRLGDPTLLTPVDFTWPPNTTWLAICNDLLAGLNYYPLWADTGGVLQTRPRVIPQLETPTVTYSSSVEPIMVVEPFQQGVDTSKPENQINVVIDDPNRTLANVLAQNNDPTSPISIPNLGYVAGVELRGSGSGAAGTKCLVGMGIAMQIAQTELGLADGIAHPAQLSTLQDPRRGAFEFYEATVRSRAGAYLTQAQLYRVEKWTFPLALGHAMTHTLNRVNPLIVTV